MNGISIAGDFLSGSTIALIIHSLDPSLISRLIVIRSFDRTYRRGRTGFLCHYATHRIRIAEYGLPCTYMFDDSLAK